MTTKRTDIIKTASICLWMLAHCALFSFLFFLFYFAYLMTLSCGHDGFTPHLVIAMIIPILNILCLILLSRRNFIKRINMLTAFVLNSVFSVIILIWVLYALGSEDILHHLIELIIPTAIVVFGSLAAMIINFKK